MELVKKIKLNYYDLTPKLQQASQSILSNLHEIPFQTIRETAKKADVSALSISRLNKIWGFKGYSDFQSNVRLEYYPVGQTKNIFVFEGGGGSYEFQHNFNTVPRGNTFVHFGHGILVWLL